MNCKSCNATNDYRFVTNCVQCGGEIQQPSAHSLQIQDEPVEPRLTWVQKVINLIYILAGSMAGLISGGVIFYFSFVVVYLVFFSGGHHTPHSCGGWDDFILMLMILAGAYLGTIGGTAVALKKPLCKAATK